MSGLWSKITAYFRGGNSSSNGKKSSAKENGTNDQYKVKRAPRTYDEVNLPNEDEEEKGTVDYTVERKPRAYEEVVLPEDSRLSQNGKPVLNYVEIDFKKTKPKPPPKNRKQEAVRQDSKTEYAAITVKNNKTVIVN